MPTLNWAGKQAVVEHHEQVPVHVLRCRPDLSAGEVDSGNLIVQGDNLLALKALLPEYAGRVKCVYIDPRLALLRELLHEAGSLWMSIDDHEMHRARMVLDEVFGEDQFVATITWQKKYSAANDSTGIPAMHDYILVYARSSSFERRLLPRTAKQDRRYQNRDGDPRGPWKTSDYTCNKTRWERPNLSSRAKVNQRSARSLIDHPALAHDLLPYKDTLSGQPLKLVRRVQQHVHAEPGFQQSEDLPGTVQDPRICFL